MVAAIHWRLGPHGQPELLASHPIPRIVFLPFGAPADLPLLGARLFFVVQGGSVKTVTRKEARKQLEFLTALETLARVLDREAKKPAKVQKAAA